MNRFGSESARFLRGFIDPDTRWVFGLRSNISIVQELFRHLVKDFKHEKLGSPRSAVAFGLELPFILAILADELEKRPFEDIRRFPFPTKPYELSVYYLGECIGYMKDKFYHAMDGVEAKREYELIYVVTANLHTYYLRDALRSFRDSEIAFAYVTNPYPWEHYLRPLDLIHQDVRSSEEELGRLLQVMPRPE